MQQTVDLVAALFNAHMELFGLEALLNTMTIPPSRQLTAGGASLEVSTPKVADECCLLYTSDAADE